MLKLIQNEWIKLWQKKGTWVMVILLAVAIIGLSGLDKFSERFTDNDVWIEEMEKDLVQIEEKLAAPDLAEEERKNLEFEQKNLQENIAMNIEWNQPKTRENAMLGTISMMSLVLLLMIVASASIVASEFSQGTIKMLLSRPVKRWKILTSKYVTVLLFGLLLTGITYITSILSAYIFFPPVEGNSVMWSGTEIAVSAVFGKSLYLVLLAFVYVCVIATLAFTIGTVFRSSALAIGISIFLFFTGSVIVVFLERFEIAKYAVFAHDLTQYEPIGSIMVEGNTMGFSIVMLIIYVVIFLAISFTTFIKRDITA